MGTPGFPGDRRRRKGWRIAAAFLLGLFGPVVYGFSSEGAGVPEEYVPVGMMLAGIFTEMGILILAWYGSQYLAWVALLFGVLSIVQRVVDRRR